MNPSLAALAARAAMHPDMPAVAGAGTTLTFAGLMEEVAAGRRELAAFGVEPGAVIGLTGAVSPSMVALLLALIDNANIVIPLLSLSAAEMESALKVGCADAVLHCAPDGTVSYSRCGHGAQHALLERLRGAQPEAGLILFTSGSTGRHKASVHSFARLMDSVMRKPARGWRTLIFLMFDHIGGMNTLLHALLHGGTAVFPPERSVDCVCQTIAANRIELLPTTPTFLNMMLMARGHERHDLSSIKLVTYGTEPMSGATLAALQRALPVARFKQTYGLTEVGILPTRSEAGSTWMQVGGLSHETRIVDGTLWIRSNSSMLGYLNAPSPFDAEGWLNTGDRVEVRGDHLRILGRESEIINVGGEKVYPAEVEEAILQVNNVADVRVSGRRSALMGQVVVATVQLLAPEDQAAVERRVRQHCSERLPAHKVPVAVQATADPLFGARFKKLRAAVVPGETHGA